MDYKTAGVNIEAGYSFIKGIRRLVESTYRPEVIGQLGGFSGLFELPSGYREPVLVAGTDGVGTKLKIAQAVNNHTTIGIDLVAMCVNDILTCGAQPLFFLDYLATGKLEPEALTQVVAGIAQGCREAGCALLGGETAEMPGFYSPGEYDVAGFAVGIVDKGQILNGSQVEIGDKAIALASSGVHSNGYSLVRRIIADHGLGWDDRPSIFQGKTLGEIFLTPTIIYVKLILEAIKQDIGIRAIAHITGGGLPENLPRCLPEHQSILIDPNSWEIPAVFSWLAEMGNVSLTDMYHTFNMGIGLVIILPESKVDQGLEYFKKHQVNSWAIGEVIAGNRELIGL